jgi:hypothetical protein
VDILLMPYNYLIDPQSRRPLQAELKNSIVRAGSLCSSALPAGNALGCGRTTHQVIIDEAHNIESQCEEAASFELSSLHIAGFIAEMDQVSAAPASPFACQGEQVPGPAPRRACLLFSNLSDGIWAGVGFDAQLETLIEKSDIPEGGTVPVPDAVVRATLKKLFLDLEAALHALPIPLQGNVS